MISKLCCWLAYKPLFYVGGATEICECQEESLKAILGTSHRKHFKISVINIFKKLHKESNGEI